MPQVTECLAEKKLGPPDDLIKTFFTDNYDFLEMLSYTRKLTHQQYVLLVLQNSSLISVFSSPLLLYSDKIVGGRMFVRICE